MKIDSRDISVVVQGAVDKNLTPKCLKSIRKYLPKSDIILSTWEGCELEGLEYDVLVLSKDPGSAKMDVDQCADYNLNRQLLSTQKGIKKVSRKYILKLRSDALLQSANFLKYFNFFPLRDLQHSITKLKIITSSLFTIDGEVGLGKEDNKIHHTPFHVSDWWHFGLTEDIRLLFSCALVDIDKFANYFKNPKYQLQWLNHRLWQFPPEQYLGIELAKKIWPQLPFKDCLDYKNISIERSQKFILSNFITLETKQSGILIAKKPYEKWCKKYWKIPSYVFPLMYRYSYYKRLYNMYFSISRMFNIDLQKLFYTFKNRKK